MFQNKMEIMDTNNIMETISEIINISNDNTWYVADKIEEEGLYLIHFKGNFETKHNNLRGIVVDINNKRILCKSSKYTYNVVLGKLPDKNDVVFNDENNQDIKINLNNVVIKYGFEGSVIRVFKHNGKIYLSTHRKINARGVIWGNSPTFEEIYKQLGGLEEELFSDNDCYCYTFIMCHRDLLCASKIVINPGFLVLLSIDKIKDTDKLPYQFNTLKELPRNIDKPFIYEPQPLTIKQANEHLKYGFHEPNLFDVDQRLLQGEFLIIYCGDYNIKVSSISYNWRLNIRGNDTNLLRRFYILEDDSIFMDEREYSYKYVKMPNYNYQILENKINERGYITNWSPQISLINRKQDSKYNIWLCFLAAIPLHNQREALGFFRKMKKDRIDVSKWLYSVHCKYRDLSETTLSKRAYNIIKEARNYSVNKLGRVRDDSVKDSISYFCNREQGHSLIKLVKEIN